MYQADRSLFVLRIANMVPAKSDARDHRIGLAKLASWNCRG